MLKTALTTAMLGLALISGEPAAAQGLPGQFGGAYAPALQPGAGVSLQQFVVGTWAIESEAGRNVATYRPDGSVNGTVYLRGRQQPLPFQGLWSVRPLGGDRFELTLTVGRRSARETLRLMADGTLYNESANAIAYRVL